MAFVDDKSFKRALFLLQSDTKAIRHNQFEIIKQELGPALRAVDFRYTQMMQLFKAFWYFLYKEDNEEMQYKICEDIARLVHELPTQREYFAQFGMNEDGVLLGEDGEELGEFAEEHAEEEFYEEELYEADEAPEELCEDEDEEEWDEAESGPAAYGSGLASRPPRGSLKYRPPAEQRAARAAEAPAPAPPDARDFVALQRETGGYTTLYLRCMFETFAREWPRVDFHRANKFMHWVRQALQHAMVHAVERGEYERVA